MESLYRPDKRPIPSWRAGSTIEDAQGKANELVLPDGTRIVGSAPSSTVPNSDNHIDAEAMGRSPSICSAPGPGTPRRASRSGYHAASRVRLRVGIGDEEVAVGRPSTDCSSSFCNLVTSLATAGCR